MASQNGQGKQEESSPLSTEAEFTQALKELARGEVTATALERQLTSLEGKIEELLALANQDQQKALEKREAQSRSSSAHGQEQNEAKSNQRH